MVLSLLGLSGRKPATHDARYIADRQRQRELEAARTNLRAFSLALRNRPWAPSGASSAWRTVSPSPLPTALPIYDTVHTLSKPEREKYRASNRLQGALAGGAMTAVGQLLAASGDAATSPSKYRERVQEVLDRRNRRTAAREAERLEGSLAARGLGIGSEAYREAQRIQAMRDAERDDSALLTSIDAAQGEANLGDTLAGTRERFIDSYRRNLTALQGGLTGPATVGPGSLSMPTARVGTVDEAGLLGDENQRRVAHANAVQSRRQALFSDLVTGAGNALSGGLYSRARGAADATRRGAVGG